MEQMMSLNYGVVTNTHGILVLVVSYNNKTVEFSFDDFFKGKNNKFDKNMLGLFETINNYARTLPQNIQEEIFEVFSKWSDNVDSPNTNYLDYSNIKKLESDLIKVADLFDYQRFKTYIKTTPGAIKITSDIKEEFIYDPNHSTTRDKTYIRDEYINLISLILFLRMLSPIYIDYYIYSKKMTNHYYYRLFLLLANYEPIINSEEINKLRVYIETNKDNLISKDKINVFIVTEGICEEDITDTIIAEILFGKLIGVDFKNNDSNFISNIYQTIRYKGKFNLSTEQSIKSKKTSNESKKEDISLFEDYRKISTVPPGVVVEIQHALSQTQLIIDTLSRGKFDYELYNNELMNIGVYEENRLESIQITLLGWFISRYINARTLHYIDYRKLVEIMLLAKVALLANGHGFIGTLLGCYRDDEIIFVSPTLKSSSLKSVTNRLSQYFQIAHEEEKTTFIRNTIEYVVDSIYSNNWRVVGSYDETYVKDRCLVTTDRLYEIVGDYIEFCLGG